MTIHTNVDYAFVSRNGWDIGSFMLGYRFKLLFGLAVVGVLLIFMVLAWLAGTLCLVGCERANNTEFVLCSDAIAANTVDFRAGRTGGFFVVDENGDTDCLAALQSNRFVQSPDRESIVWEVVTPNGEDDRLQLFWTDVESNETVELINGSVDDTRCCFAWSPDGSYLALSHTWLVESFFTQSDVLVLDLESGEVRTVAALFPADEGVHQIKWVDVTTIEYAYRMMLFPVEYTFFCTVDVESLATTC